jgi:hypothetical protein
MGFQKPKKVYKLVWPEDHELHGLEVRVHSLPLGQFMELMSLSNLSKSSGFGEEDRQQVHQLFTGFAGALVSWNLEDEDPRGEDFPSIPVSPDLDGLYSQDFGFVMQIIMAWMDAVANVSVDLGKASQTGGTSPEASIPMEPLSSGQSI